VFETAELARFASPAQFGEGEEAVQLLERSAVAAVLEDHIRAVRDVLLQVDVGAVEQVVDIILDAYRRGQHVYVLGNGGSASTATHFACDLSKATIVEGRARLRVTSLTDNVALLTAWANDTSYENVFAEQLSNLLNAGDVVVAISASGNSPNVLAAVRTGRALGAKTVAIVGFGGGLLKPVVDAAVYIPSDSYGVVEDCHLVLEHAITESTRCALLG
jgi:D-sedoheptulose 7-phosphate isomerase